MRRGARRRGRGRRRCRRCRTRAVLKMREAIRRMYQAAATWLRDVYARAGALLRGRLHRDEFSSFSAGLLQSAGGRSLVPTGPVSAERAAAVALRKTLKPVVFVGLGIGALMFCSL